MAKDWLLTLGPLRPAVVESESVKYLNALREARECAQAYETLNDFACPVALHLAYLEESAARSLQLDVLLAAGVEVPGEQAELRTAVQGHHQQLSWDLVELAKRLAQRGGHARVDVPRMGRVGRSEVLEAAEKHARESHRMLAEGETTLTGPALQGASGAAKKNIALVLTEVGAEHALIDALLNAAKHNYDAHGSVPEAAYQEVGALPPPQAAAAAARQRDAPRTEPGLAEAGLCIICTAQERSIMFQPCRHVCCCAACASAWDATCPVCRQPIASQLAVILP